MRYRTLPIFGFLLIAWSSSAGAGTGAPRIDHASIEDCAIIVAVGLSDLGWGKTGHQPLYVDVLEPDGTVFREDCPWQSLGIRAPVVAKPPMSGNTIFRPEYGASHITATVTYDSRIYAPPHDDVPMVAAGQVKLEKSNGRWKVLSEF